MRFQGKITKWEDAKGFGFITPNGGGEEVFLHISAFSNQQNRPSINDLVTYITDQDKSGRMKANKVSYVVPYKWEQSVEPAHRMSLIFISFTLLFTAFVFERTINGFLPRPFPLIFIGANLISFLYYYVDKTAAIKQQWRTQESTLHFISLIGGWGGAYIVQKMFHHKNKKASFLFTYKLTVLINCTLIILFAIPNLLRLMISKFNALII